MAVQKTLKAKKNGSRSDHSVTKEVLKDHQKGMYAKIDEKTYWAFMEKLKKNKTSYVEWLKKQIDIYIF
jgi:hypothetical protein